MNKIKLCIVTEFVQEDYFQWTIALKNRPEFELESLVVTPLSIFNFGPDDDFWKPVKNADVVFIYLVRRIETWEYYKLPMIVKEHMREDARLIVQEDLDYLWAWYPTHHHWETNIRWTEDKTPEQFFQNKILEVADAHLAFFNRERLSKVTSRPVYELNLPQLVRYQLYLKEDIIKEDFQKRKGMAVLRHSVHSAHAKHTIEQIKEYPCNYFSSRIMDNEVTQKDLFQSKGRLYSKMDREAYLHFLKQNRVAVDDNEGYIGWSRFAMECAIQGVPCVGSTMAVKELFPDLYTEHKDYQRQKVLLDKLYNDIDFWYDQVTQGRENVYSVLNTEVLIDNFILIIEEIKTRPTIYFRDMKLSDEGRIPLNYDEYQKYLTYCNKHFPQGIPTKPRNGAIAFDGTIKRMINEFMWDSLYGKWEAFINGEKPTTNVSYIQLKEPDMTEFLNKQYAELNVPKNVNSKGTTISVVVGVRDRVGKLLNNFITSLLIQTDRDFETIIVDYGSNETNRRILFDECAKAGFKYIFYPAETWSRTRAFNVGIAKATKDFVVTSDVDMIFRKDFIERLKVYAKPKTFIMTKAMFLSENFNLDANDWDNFYKYALSDYQGPSLGAIQCAEREWFVKVNGYDERMSGWGHEDNDMADRAKADGLIIEWLEGPIVAHQWHDISPYRKDVNQVVKNSKCKDKVVIKRGENYGWNLKPEELVTIILPVVAKVETAKQTIEGIMKYANFPYVFKVIINPELTDLIKWCEDRNIIVIKAFYFPIVRAKSEMVKLCTTKYMFMFDDDLCPTMTLKPLLDLMELHPDIGIVATALQGHRHNEVRFGMNAARENDWFILRPCPKTATWHYCNYVHHGATLFRMDVFKDVYYDVETYGVGQGWEHEDLFYQLMDTKWKIVSYDSILVQTLEGENSDSYNKIRREGVYKNVENFKRKWQLIGVRYMI